MGVLVLVLIGVVPAERLQPAAGYAASRALIVAARVFCGVGHLE